MNAAVNNSRQSAQTCAVLAAEELTIYVPTTLVYFVVCEVKQMFGQNAYYVHIMKYI